MIFIISLCSDNVKKYKLMKLRIKGNSVRLRVTKSEIDQFGNGESITETTNFGSTKLTYILKQSNSEHINARFESDTIIVEMPKQLATQWTNSERVGYETNMPLNDGSSLFILLEKDFKCLDGTHEDQSDMYENPLADQHP
jgi:hypothetical protein